MSVISVSEKHLSFSSFIPSGIVKLVSATSPWNIPIGIASISAGKFLTSAKEVHPENAPAPLFTLTSLSDPKVAPSGRVTDVKFTQPQSAQLLIERRESGNVTEENLPVCMEFGPNAVTPSGISNSSVVLALGQKRSSTPLLPFSVQFSYNTPSSTQKSRLSLSPASLISSSSLQ